MPASAVATVIDIMGLNIGVGSLGLMAGGAITAVTFWFKVKSEGRETRREQAEARKMEAQSLDARLHPIETAITTFKSKEALAEDKAAVMREVDDIRHDLKNESARINQLDKLRQDADRWQAQKDVTIANLEKGLERVEAKIDKNHQETLDAIRDKRP